MLGRTILSRMGSGPAGSPMPREGPCTHMQSTAHTLSADHLMRVPATDRENTTLVRERSVLP